MRRESSILSLPDYDCRVRSEQPVASRSLLAVWLPWVTHGSSMLHSLSHPPPVSLFVYLLLIPSHSQPHSLPSSCLPLSFPPGLSSPSSLSCSLFSPNFMSCFWIFLFFSFSLPFVMRGLPPLIPLPLHFYLLFFFFAFCSGVSISLTSVESHLWSEAVSCYHSLFSSHSDKEVFF